MAKPSVHAGTKDLKQLGVAIRKLRVDRGLSQEALAVDAGIDRSYMGGIERGEHNVALVNLLKIARCLGVDASTLFSLSGL